MFCASRSTEHKYSLDLEIVHSNPRSKNRNLISRVLFSIRREVEINVS